MRHSAIGLIWVFLAAPWLAWVAFHPFADVRLAWTLAVRPREAGVAVTEVLHNAYEVPPFSYMFNVVRQTRAVRPPTCLSTYCGKAQQSVHCSSLRHQTSCKEAINAGKGRRLF